MSNNEIGSRLFLLNGLHQARNPTNLLKNLAFITVDKRDTG